MHASSLENMQKCYERFVGSLLLHGQDKLRVLDIGGANVNGSYSDIFSDDRFEYMAVDLQAGPGVDVVLQDPYTLPFDSSSIDIVISGQVFEHAEFFWKLFEEMVRILKYNGLLFLIAPSSGPIHRFPVDCYRFYPDSMAALARYANVRLIDTWLDDRGPWNDLVGVFTRNLENYKAIECSIVPVNRYMEQTSVAPLFDMASSPEYEVTSGKAHYLETLKIIHSILQPRSYLEIGIRQGRSLSLASCQAIAVDPQPEMTIDLQQRHRLYRKTSDEFFERNAAETVGRDPPDLVFIDGMHLFEFALRDFINVERYSLPTTLVVIDDVYPNHPMQAQRKRQTKVWTGDVWKLYACLKAMRPDLLLLPLDTSPTGLLLVAGLDAKNRILTERYNPLVRQYKEMTLTGHEKSVLERDGALHPNNQILTSLLTQLRLERDSPRYTGLGVRLRKALGI